MQTKSTQTVYDQSQKFKFLLVIMSSTATISSISRMSSLLSLSLASPIALLESSTIFASMVGNFAKIACKFVFPESHLMVSSIVESLSFIFNACLSTNALSKPLLYASSATSSSCFCTSRLCCSSCCM